MIIDAWTSDIYPAFSAIVKYKIKSTKYKDRSSKFAFSREGKGRVRQNCATMKHYRQIVLCAIGTVYRTHHRRGIEPTATSWIWIN